jgi:oligopeptide transport system ATP-binding protein
MKTLLEIHDLNIWFPRRSSGISRIRDYIKAVTGVSFEIREGETVGLVGESGSGKTTVGKAILHLAKITSGEIFFEGAKISHLSDRNYQPYRRKIQMIFQDPSNSLNPRWTVLKIISEPLQIYFKSMSTAARREQVSELMKKVGLTPDQMHRYPHEFSGGQRQRIGIARALAVQPKLIVCDEPVSALDVSVQAQIVNLLQDIQEELGISYLFIGHDLAVIEHISDRVVVMHRGEMVENADADEIYRNPKADYTRKLLESVPGFHTTQLLQLDQKSR